MSAIPKILVQTLQRFQGQQSRVQTLFSVSRKQFYGGDQISFKFPTSGILDLSALTAWFQLVVQSTATATTGFTGVLTPEYAASFFSRVEVYCGGTQLGMSAQQNYADCYYISRRLCDSTLRKKFLQNFGLANSLSVNAASTATFVNIMADDWLGLLGGHTLRYLPLDILPSQLEIVITLNPLNRWFDPSSAAQFTNIDQNNTFLNNFQFMLSIIEFPDNWLSAAWAKRIGSDQGLAFPFENYALHTGNQFNGSTSFTFMHASQSIEQSFVTLRPSDYQSNTADSIVLTSGSPLPTTYNGTDVSYNMLLQGVPICSLPLNVTQMLWDSVAAQSANSSIDFSPDITLSQYQTSRFVWLHNFAFGGLDPQEERYISSGLNTMGVNALFEVQVNNANSANTYVPVCLFRMKSIMSLQAGGILGVIN